MDLNNSILIDIRLALDLSDDDKSYDTTLLMHINSAIGELNQVGVGKNIIVEDDGTTWKDLQNPDQVKGNELFKLIPEFILLNTKLIFDPPPPSAVEFYVNNIQKLLWRLKAAYELPYQNTTSQEDT